MNNSFELSQRASRKAFAKVTMLNIEVSRLKKDVKEGNTGGITADELLMVYEGTKTELEVWSHIARIIEINNK